MRAVVLLVALAFIGAVGALTVLDIVHYGFSAVDALAIIVLVLFSTGIVGALRHPPAK